MSLISNNILQKLFIFTPYSKRLNDEVVEYFKKENFNVTSNSYFDIETDIEKFVAIVKRQAVINVKYY